MSISDLSQFSTINKAMSTLGHMLAYLGDSRLNHRKISLQWITVPKRELVHEYTRICSSVDKITIFGPKLVLIIYSKLITIYQYKKYNNFD